MGGWNKGQKSGTVIKCEYCGEEFYSYPYRHTISKYCSRKCYHMATRKTNVFVCLNCGKEVLDAKKGRLFCSTECASKYRASRPRKATIGKSGYRYVWFSDGTGEPEHRYLIEQIIGRKLDKDEIVHHKDEDRSNNSLDNLEVMSRREHSKLHRKMEIVRGKELFHADKQQKER